MLKHKHLFYFLLFLPFLWSCEESNTNIPTQDFNDDWQFFKGEAEGAELTNFDDSDWRRLNLPHDWAIEGPFSIENNARTGGLPVTGTGWYRKHFTLDASLEGKQISVTFDGAMNDAHVWVNGKFAGKRPYGYIGFEIDLTPFVKFGEENLIAVRLSPKDLSARWYPGAGIYRNVYLNINNPVHIPLWGTYITTPEVSKEKARVNIRTNVVNKGATSLNANVQTIIKDQEGNVVATANTQQTLEPNALAQIEEKFDLNNPKLWHIGQANLYTVSSIVKVNNVLMDEYSSEFGIRDIDFTAAEGFKLNGEVVRMNGVCMHHDMGPLGSAINYRAKERQMQIMQSMGVNALRTSHNPPSPEWLQICDRLGIVVIVEAFDEWKMGKVENGYNQFFDEWHEKDLRDMIRRDRNHPSVIMWSIGNEILEQGVKDGWKLAKKLSDICHDEDITRPTTAGFNYYPAPFTNKLAFQIDVVGMNYWPLNYSEIIEKYPNMIVYGSETSSQTSSRGVYHLPIEAAEQHETNQVSSYDVIVGPPWAYPPDVEFEQQEKNPTSLGEFMWTGFDYLGEPTPYGGRDNSTNGYWNLDWPSHSSYFAPVDLVGFPKDRYYLYQSQWTETPMVHVLPHWNWAGKEGEMIPVYAYTNCDEVELFVNGKSMGKRIKGIDTTPIPAEFHFFEKGIYHSKYRLSWNVPYTPGAIKVVAYTNGKKMCEKEIKTAGATAKIALEADRSEINADGKDLSYIAVIIQDKDGNICPLADNRVHFTIEGKGSIAGVGNGDPTNLESFQADNFKAFNGKLMLIVRSTKEAGDITVKVSGEGLENQSLTIASK